MTSSNRDLPEPATHGRTISVGEYELAPSAQLQKADVGPLGASEYTTFIVLDVDPDAGELELFRPMDRARRTVTAAGLEADLGKATFVVDDGTGDD